MTTETEATPKAPAVPDKGAKKAKPAKPETRLLKPARQVLGTLVRANGPLSRRTIADRVGKKEKLVNGRIAAETKTYASLASAKLIRAFDLDVDGKTETVNEITEAGRKAYAAAK